MVSAKGTLVLVKTTNMNSKVLIFVVLCGLLALQITNVEGICYQYVCRRRCVYRPPRYEEYAFRYLWPRVCGQAAVQRYGIKACCVTYGRY